MVMSTGIVSVCLSHLPWAWGAQVLLVVGALGWLAAIATGELVRELAGVPATCVLGTRVAELGWTAVAYALLVVGVALWCVRIVSVRWSEVTGGSDFLPVVATQALAVAASTLAREDGVAWLHVPSVVLLIAGVVMYTWVVVRFDPRELRSGSGDQWIAGGALAISALACATIAGAWSKPSALVIGSDVLGVAAAVWLPVLVAGELLHPRRGEMPGRWSTAFPVGMYAAMAFTIGSLDGARWLRNFADGWTWIAVALWLVLLGRWARGEQAT